MRLLRSLRPLRLLRLLRSLRLLRFLMAWNSPSKQLLTFWDQRGCWGHWGQWCYHVFWGHGGHWGFQVLEINKLMARITLFWCFWTKIFLSGMMEIEVKFCHLSGLRLWRTGMLFSTKSKDHKSNFRISWMSRYLFYDFKVHFWWPNKSSKHQVLSVNTLYIHKNSIKNEK